MLFMTLCLTILQVDRDGALLKLMQFFVSASGCKGKITSEMQADMDHGDIIRSVSNLLLWGGGEIILIN